MATFSIILPTTGRPTLKDAFASVADQLEPGDEVLVVCDRSGDSGNSARNDAIARARGSHLLFLDDDDELVPGALAKVRRFADEHPGRIGIFRTHYELLEGPWHEATLRQTGSANLCVPNLPGRLGRFGADGDPRPGDREFIRQTVELQGEPIWQTERIIVIRPEKSRWRRLRYKAAPKHRFRARFLGASRDGIWRGPET
jgi:glycosyltransferase involved in cell wall biosynthesis